MEPARNEFAVEEQTEGDAARRLAWADGSACPLISGQGTSPFSKLLKFGQNFNASAKRSNGRRVPGPICSPRAPESPATDITRVTTCANPTSLAQRRHSGGIRMSRFLPSFSSRNSGRQYWELQESGSNPSEGLLDPTGGSDRRYRRPLGLLSFGGRRKIWTACAVICLGILALWAYEQFSTGDTGPQEDLSKYTGELPWGSAHDVDGEEVFWWEQFPE